MSENHSPERESTTQLSKESAERLEKLLQENLARSELLLEKIATLDKIYHWVLWQRAWFVIKIIIILIPIILGIIYLPPFIESWIEPLQRLLSFT